VIAETLCDEDEAKVETLESDKDLMPPTKTKKLSPMKGLTAIKYSESIIAKWRESNDPPHELTSVHVVELKEHEIDGKKYWLDSANKRLYNVLPNGVGPYIGQLNPKGKIEGKL
jgi:hypothetical protein